MPAKKNAAKKPTKSFEESLWETATKLRGSVESAEYKHIVLSLIFLKFVSDKFPPTALVERFAFSASPLFEYWILNIHQSYALATLRNTLTDVFSQMTLENISNI